MKINAIGADYSAIRARNARGTKAVESQPQGIDIPKGMSMISFKGGNKGDVLHVIAEVDPSFTTGGVATVGKDYKSLNNISKTEHGRTVIFTPYYNGNIQYDSESGELIKSVDVLKVPSNLPEGHPMKNKAGTPFFTKEDLSAKSIEDILKDPGKFIELEEVAQKDMQWGLQEKSPIKLYKIPANKAKCPANTDIFFVYTEGTASMVKPYEGGGYATTQEAFVKSWNGDPYAQFDKATVELMQDIDKKVKGFDPGTVICSDSHAAYVSHYMAQKNAAGEEYFKGKKPTQVGHNLGNGYIGFTSPRNMLINLGATKEQIETLINSKEYQEALLKGSEDEFLLKFLSPLTTETKKTVSAMDIPIYYGLKGYLPMFSTVSEGYHDATLNNLEVAPSLNSNLKKLDELKRYIGLTNALNDSGTSAFAQLGLAGYGKDAKYKLANGEEITVKAFEKFDKTRSEDLQYVREIKKQNKINLIERFQPKFDGARVVGTDGQLLPVKDSENLLRAGHAGKQHEVIGGFAPEYIQKLRSGEDIKLAVSWGRGDFQKGLDSVVDGFEKFVNKTGDKNTLLLLGGDLSISPEEGDRVINRVKILSQKENFKGRIVLMDGFAPGLPFASAADVSVFPSRFAPCELTDLESKHMLCTPIVTNCQGLGQKNFDPDVASDANLADGFKTKHEFYMPEAECLKDGVASEKAKADFLKVKNKLADAEKAKFKIRTGNELPEAELEIRLAKNSKYQKALRELRDSIISDELAECYDRALNKYRTGDVANKILKNQVHIDTTWEGNGWLSKTKLSAAELYRQKHIKPDATNISEKDLIKFDFSGLTEGGKTSGGRNGGSLKEWLTKNKKAAIIAGSALGIIGLGYAGYKAGWFSTKFEEKKDGKNLSCVG